MFWISFRPRARVCGVPRAAHFVLFFVVCWRLCCCLLSISCCLLVASLLLSIDYFVYCIFLQSLHVLFWVP
jgi:hypothetical protein